MKECSTCRESKPFTEFYKKRDSITGCQAACKKCHNIARQASREKNPDQAKKWDRNRKYTPEAKARRLRIGRARNQFYRDTLADCYIANLLAMHSQLKPEDISQDLIKATRVNLELKRALGLTNIKKETDVSK